MHKLSYQTFFNDANDVEQMQTEAHCLNLYFDMQDEGFSTNVTVLGEKSKIEDFVELYGYTNNMIEEFN